MAGPTFLQAAFNQLSLATNQELWEGVGDSEGDNWARVAFLWGQEGTAFPRELGARWAGEAKDAKEAARCKEAGLHREPVYLHPVLLILLFHTPPPPPLPPPPPPPPPPGNRAYSSKDWVSALAQYGAAARLAQPGEDTAVVLGNRCGGVWYGTV